MQQTIGVIGIDYSARSPQAASGQAVWVLVASSSSPGLTLALQESYEAGLDGTYCCPGARRR